MAIIFCPSLAAGKHVRRSGFSFFHVSGPLDVFRVKTWAQIMRTSGEGCAQNSCFYVSQTWDLSFLIGLQRFSESLKQQRSMASVSPTPSLHKRKLEANQTVSKPLSPLVCHLLFGRPCSSVRPKPGNTIFKCPIFLTICPRMGLRFLLCTVFLKVDKVLTQQMNYLLIRMVDQWLTTSPPHADQILSIQHIDMVLALE